MQDYLKILQESELTILKEFVKICEKFSLKYYLAYGTLLGAKRHNGFIPWDDDVDVIMPRNDFELFCNKYYTFLSSQFCFKHYKVDTSYCSYIPRIEYQSVVMTDAFNVEHNAWIDIFPLDGLPTKKTLKYYIHKFRLIKTRCFMNVARINNGIIYNSKRKEGKKNFSASFCKFFRLYKFFNLQRELNKIDLLLKKYNPEKTKKCVSFLGEKFKDECNIEYYGNGRKICFEGIDMQVPLKSELLLTQLYGDYMKLPPEDKRNVHNLKFVRYNKTNEKF